MARTPLRRIFELFKENDTSLSLGFIAHQLDVTPERAESMLEFWIQKRMITLVEEKADCSTCGVNETCPFVYQFPTSYQLIKEDS
jgi:hypothetical protein